MLSDSTIEVTNLSKCYQIYEKPRDRLLQMLCRGRRKYYRDFWALKDISFQVKRGETVGIVGRNGSGKSTLLQLICGTLNPTAGKIQINGRIAALLELGSGFNPEFTGRENVFLNAEVLGLTQAEIEQRFPDIVAFADIGDFLDQPVKTYSSGMYVRLAFSVAMHVFPDILIIDEALSVGDIRFQTKCMRAIEEIKKKGTSILFVSHSPGQIEALCDRAIWLEDGYVKYSEAPKNVMRKYINYIEHGIDEEPNPGQTSKLNSATINEKQPPQKHWVSVSASHNTAGNRSAVIRRVMTTINDDDLLSATNSEASKITISIALEAMQDIYRPLIAVGLFNSLNEPIIHFNTENAGITTESLAANSSHIFKISFNVPALKPGEYLISVGLDDGVMGASQVIFHLYDAWPFSVVSGKEKKTQAGYIQTNTSDIWFEHAVEAK